MPASAGYLPRRERAGAARRRRWSSRARCKPSPQRAVVAGDVRANENIALTAMHTLFLREHNRIVDSLPAELPEEAKFQIARRVVIAETSTSPTRSSSRPSGSGSRPTAGYLPNVECHAVERVRHRRLPGPLHDPRRDRRGGDGGRARARDDSRRSKDWGSRSCRAATTLNSRYP